MDDSVDPAVQYIRATRDRYTREAITQRLLEMGQDPTDVERAWAIVDAGPPIQSRDDWRPGWVAGVVLVGIGAVGAYLVWRDEPYGAGGIAPAVYVAAASLAFATGKAASVWVDAGQPLAVAIVMALVLGAIVLVVANASPPEGWVVAVTVGAVAFGTAILSLGSNHSRVVGYAGAAFPLFGWLAVTGVCYSPLFGR